MDRDNSANVTWVVEQIEKIAKFGQDRAGITRLAFSEADRKARSYVIGLMQQAGLTVHIDSIGNIVGRYQPDSITGVVPAVATGSHLDTVPSGGKYDGVLGVVCGLAAVDRLIARGGLSHPLEVIVFAAEESSRFTFSTIGSKAMAGLGNTRSRMKIKDAQGVSLAEALVTAGINPDENRSAQRAKDSLKAFVELHIEQGYTLEQEKIKIGMVETIAAPTRLKITVEGTAAHSSVIPLDERQDALVSAAQIVLSVRDIAAEYSSCGVVATVTILNTHPGAINVVPGRCDMWVDIRGTDHASIIEILQEIKDAISTIADDNDTPVAIEVLTSEKPVALNEMVNSTIEKVCTKLKHSCMRLDSQAGHDAMNMAFLAPSGLIFVPCRGGITHNIDEFAHPDDITAGLDVLTETLYQLAK